MESNLPRWHEIICECGSAQFEAVFTYRWHPTGGTSRGDEIERCVKCHEPVNARRAMQLVRKRQLQSEMRQLNELIGEEAPSDQVLTPEKNASSVTSGRRLSG